MQIFDKIGRRETQLRYMLVLQDLLRPQIPGADNLIYLDE